MLITLQPRECNRQGCIPSGKDRNVFMIDSRQLCNSIRRTRRSTAAVAVRTSAISVSVLLLVLFSLAPVDGADVKETRRKPESRDNGRDRSQGKRGDGDQARFRGMDRDNDGLISRAEWRGNDK